jgi:hypothetical protein
MLAPRAEVWAGESEDVMRHIRPLTVIRAAADPDDFLGFLENLRLQIQKKLQKLT